MRLLQWLQDGKSVLDLALSRLKFDIADEIRRRLVIRLETSLRAAGAITGELESHYKDKVQNLMQFSTICHYLSLSHRSPSLCEMNIFIAAIFLVATKSCE